MRRPFLKRVVNVLAIDGVIAILVPVFQSLFGSHIPFSQLVRQYFIAVVYSNLIGVPIYLALPPVWSRTLRLPLLLRSVLRITVILLANLIGCLSAGIVLRGVMGANYEYWAELRSSLGISLVLSAIAVSFFSMYETQQARIKNTAMQLRTKELERERALKLATEARLSSLEARIHPHFLFNTINSVSSLIHEDPARAERILTQLAELLRFSLDTARGGLVPLERELQIVEDYLEIEKARYGSRLRYAIRAPAAMGNMPVPPLSLQTLVENSVKYAVTPHSRGATVTVTARQNDEFLCLQVDDDGPGFANLELPAGHGLNNLQERVTVLFGERSKLNISRHDGVTSVAIEIPHPVSPVVREPSEATLPL